MRALVVDDDIASRLALVAILSPLAEVESCGDGADAVEAALQALRSGTPYDLICIDIVMPVMNGLDALRLIRQEEEAQGRPRTSRVIITSSNDEAGSIDQAFDNLCDAYLIKPIDGQRFLDILTCVCDVAVAP